MEPQGSGKRPADQLQGAVIQDQAIQSGSAAEAIHSASERQGISAPADAPSASRSEKVVIQFGSKTIKGYLDSSDWSTVEELLSNAPAGSPQSFRIRHLESNEIEEILAQDIKAVFYVNSFEGDSDHEMLNFHSRAPIIHGIWMRLQFLDGEVMEGIVYNSIRYLVDPGFFLLPTDPESNNRLIYVRKNWLADHRVLGMRKL
jgi:hypothetical protein